MARIDKAEHSKILQAVDGEHRKVTEVAAQYACTPAAIYALLAKLRKPAVAGDSPVGLPSAPLAPAADLFAAPGVAPAARRAEVVPPPAPTREPPKAIAPPVAPVMEEASATVTELPRRPARPTSGRGGVGASLARPGYGLAMRSGDGEESMTPFRSLDDLLSAIKPILRSAARSPDAV